MTYGTHTRGRRPAEMRGGGSSRRIAAAAGLDPVIVEAITDVVRLVQGQQQRDVAEQATAARAVKPERPALRRVYDVAGAANQLSLSESKVWALIKAGRIRTVKVDARTLITAVELDRFVAEEVHPG